MLWPVTGKDLKCLPSDKKVCRFHLFLHDLISIRVKIRRDPSAIRETAYGSSSGPPGACITPSSVMNDKTMIFLMEQPPSLVQGTKVHT